MCMGGTTRNETTRNDMAQQLEVHTASSSASSTTSSRLFPLTSSLTSWPTLLRSLPHAELLPPGNPRHELPQPTARAARNSLHRAIASRLSKSQRRRRRGGEGRGGGGRSGWRRERSDGKQYAAANDNVAFVRATNAPCRQRNCAKNQNASSAGNRYFLDTRSARLNRQLIRAHCLLSAP